MAILQRSSAGTGTALFYITVGALMTIWSAVWYLALGPQSRLAIALCAGLFLSGVAFLVIGFSLGRIAREAKRAEAEEPVTDAVDAGMTYAKVSR